MTDADARSPSPSPGRLPRVLPASRVPDPRLAPSLRWGIMGSGWIAERFVDALQRLTGQRVVANGSRTAAAAEAFGSRFGIDRRHGSYEQLVADPEVDVVYVATPHNAHFPCAALALQAGKHVLVEKPLALNADESRRLAGLAAAAQRFCAEALWSFFLPKLDVLRQLLDDGVLGRVHTVLADFGDCFPPDHRIMRHDLAGGPLLDLGTYPVAFAGWVLGTPTEVLARGQQAPSGVNGQAALLLGYPDGALATIHTTLFSSTPGQATIGGEQASVSLPDGFFRPGPFSVESGDHARRLDFTEPATAYDGLCFQAAEVARRVAAGELESPVRPLADSVATLQVIDEARRQLGVVFEEEETGGEGGGREPAPGVGSRGSARGLR